jgi:uncharacterized protein (TIGR00251 family)
MRFAIEVRPGSKKSEVIKLADGDFKVFVKAPAAEGKANAEAKKILAKYFGVSQSGVRIVRGARGRKKVLEIED